MDFSLGREIKNNITGGPFRLGLEFKLGNLNSFFLALQFFYLVVSNTLTLKLNVI